MEYEKEYKFRQIKNRIKKFDTLSLVQIAAHRLHWCSRRQPYELQGYNPWDIFLLIKWAFVFGGKAPYARTANQSEFIYILNQIQELSNCKNKFLSQRQTTKFLRTIAFQQFWFQESLTLDELGRQATLFLDIRSSYPIKDIFKEKTGIELEDFFDLCFMLWTRFGLNEVAPHIQSRWFSAVADSFPQGTIDNFLSLLSLNFEETKKLFCDQQRTVSRQLTEITPLARHPLLKAGETFWCYSPNLISVAISNFIYDFMKPQPGFSSAFGKILEKYIALGLDHLKAPYNRESELQSLYPGKAVDFAFPTSLGTVLIESKAIELSEIAQLDPENEILIKALRSSIVKGVLQAFESAHKIKSTKNQHALKSNRFFVLIVTYRDLHLGPGETVWSEFLKETIHSELERKSIPEDTIDPNDIFFVSIRDYDYLIRAAKNCDAVGSILSEASQSNKNPEAAKFSLGLHLGKYGFGPSPRYIDDAFKAISDRCTKRITPNV